MEGDGRSDRFKYPLQAQPEAICSHCGGNFVTLDMKRVDWEWVCFDCLFVLRQRNLRSDYDATDPVY